MYKYLLGKNVAGNEATFPLKCIFPPQTLRPGEKWGWLPMSKRIFHVAFNTH